MIRKIKVDSLRAGMYVHGLLKASGEPFLLDCVHLITGKKEREQYCRDGFLFAYVDSEDEAAMDKTDTPNSVEFDEEISSARKIKRTARDVVRSFMASAAIGKSISTDNVEVVVDSMVDSVFRNMDALFSLARFKDYDNYTSGHSINVCILSLVFAKHQGYSREEMQIIGLGALLHDIGKVSVSEAILYKFGPLRENELMEVKKHVVEGVRILKYSDLNDEVLDIVAQHHERYDGSGYPNGLRNKRISPYAKIVAISDVYDAMTSTRPYRSQVSPSNVLRNFFTLKESYFEPDIVESFIMCMGVNPQKGGVLSPIW